MLNIEIDAAGYAEGENTVRDIRFSIAEGEQIGLIGPNGAGKSTTIKAMLGLLPSFHGQVVWKDDATRYVYIPERPVFYNELTLWEHLVLAASSFSLEETTFEKRAHELLRIFSMENEKHHLLDSFSKGMQQKAMLMIGLTLEPDLYIVDEPFIGLDPRATKTLLRLLDEERRRGAAVLMSTHVLDTAEKICDRFLLVTGGTLIASGHLASLREQAGVPDASLLDCFDRLTEDVR